MSGKYVIATYSKWDTLYDNYADAEKAAREQAVNHSSPTYIVQQIAKLERPSDNVMTTTL